jgi:N6-adenosine-specific RNA methylase IME4
MSIEELRALPVKDITDKDALLFLWVTFPKLAEAMTIFDAWGFTYKTCAFTWAKTNRKSPGFYFGLGFWTRGGTELCLLGTKGHPKRESAYVPQICTAPLTYHSHKPDEIRDRIVTLCGDRPRMELFAREKVEGWDCLGNEIDGRDIREAILTV